MVAITAGVVRGKLVEGIRYPASEGVTGWYLMPAGSNPEEFMPVHATHLFESRPDIARFLGLPAGWSFDTRDSGHVWFDNSVAHDHEAVRLISKDRQPTCDAEVRERPPHEVDDPQGASRLDR